MEVNKMIMKINNLVLAVACLCLTSCLNAPQKTEAPDRGSGQSRPAAVQTFPEFEKYGLRIVFAPSGEVAGDAEIVLSAKEKLELSALLEDKATGNWITDASTISPVEGGWIIRLEFPKSGAYELNVVGKPQSDKENRYLALFTMTFQAKVDDAYWRTTSDFARLGLAVVSVPPRAVEGDTNIVLSGGQGITIAYDFKNTTTGERADKGVGVANEKGNWNISLSFLDSGDYELSLYGKAAAAADFVKLASLRLKVNLKDTPNETLAKAVQMNDPVRLKSALEQGADPNIVVKDYSKVTSEGVTTVIDAPAVFFVLRWYMLGIPTDREIEALRLLKTHGADFHAVTSEGQTLLSTLTDFPPGNAAEEMKLCKALLELGADPAQDTVYTYYKVKDQRVQTKISMLLDLEKCGYQGTEKYAAYIPLFIQYRANPHPVWPWGWSALHNLFENYSAGAKVFIQAYLDAGVDPSPEDLWNLILTVISRRFDNDFDFIAKVLAKTTHINDQEEGPLGQTFLHHLAFVYEKPSPALKKLLSLALTRKADINACNRLGRTPLMVAVEQLSTAGIDELLACGADPKRPGSTGETVFHVLVSLPWSNAVGALIDRFLALKVDINARNLDGKTPFYIACYSDKNMEFVKLLIKKGADPALPDVDGCTALGYARSMGCAALTKYLISLHVPEAQGGWPVGNEAPACRAVLGADPAAIAALPPADFESRVARTRDGVPSTPLHLAAESGNLQVIGALSAKKVHWDTGDRYGRTPLEMAVLEGNIEVVKALVNGGADPNARDDRGATPLIRALEMNSNLADTLLNCPVEPDWENIGIPLAVSSPLDFMRKLPRVKWSADVLNACVALGRTDILEYLGPSIKSEESSAAELLAEAKKSKDVFDAYEAEAKQPLAVKNAPAAERDRKGTYTLTLSWSPWIDADPKVNLSQFPVVVFVPKGYDGGTPYGLIVSMMNAQSANQAPAAAYLGTLEKHKLIYVGFDPYNGIFNAGSKDYFLTDHERLCLAAVHYIFGHYAVDRKRVYLTGFSWGGRLTGEIVPKQPRVFTGGIAVGGCFISGERIIPSYPYARTHAAMVLATGDWDYNRQETYNGYSTFLMLGYEAHFFQEPRKGHSRISGENFEKAVTLLDEASGRRP
jgi:ankyrin repeat protein